MCGIAGIALSPNADVPDLRERLLRMQAALRHRGPDDAGLYVSPDGRVGLVNCRLAIQDLTPAGHMPMQSERSAAVLTQNGEIYNVAELRSELERQGARFHSSGDSEVILRGYEQWGEAVVARLRGIFAFALYDGQRVLLARDPLGVKPLYTSQTAQGLLFASELTGLLASGLVSRAIDPAAVSGYLMLGAVPCPRTIYRAVQMLEPAHTQNVAGGAAGMARRYWELPGTIDTAAEHPDAIGETRALLQDAVRSQLVSDVPLGAFLSGGLDSTAVAALMRAASGGVLRTCSMVFDEPGYSEAPFARAAAQALGAEHYERLIGVQDLTGDMQQILRAMDQPTSDGINTWFVSKTAREAGLTVALSGLGGDELFGGYAGTFRGAPRLLRGMQLAHALPGGAALGRTVLGSAAHGRYARAAHALSELPSRAGAYFSYRGLFTPGEVQQLMQPEAWAEAGEAFDPIGYIAERATRHSPLANDDPFAWSSRAELTTYTLNQLLRDTDVMGMAHSLEVRVPLLDPVLVERVLRMPAALKTGGAGSFDILRQAQDARSSPKPLLLKAVYDLLPPLVRERRDKQGFVFPFDAWLRGPLGQYFAQGQWSEDGPETAKFLRPGALAGLRQAHADNRIHWSRLWTVTVLQAWLGANAN